LTSEYFHKRKDLASGFGNVCKVCAYEKQKELRRKKKEGKPVYSTPQIPEEHKGKAFVSDKGNLMYTECVDCGEPKTSYDFQRRARCNPCAANHRKNVSSYNLREGFRICKTCEEEKPLTLEHFYRCEKREIWYGSCILCKRKKCRITSKTPEARAKTNQRYSRRRKTDLVYHLRTVVSSSVYQALRRNKGGKRGGSVLDFLPYSIAELKEHLEKQFEAGMSWENWGKGKDCWNIDHIYPHSKLPYDTLDHPNFQKAWALDNLRPLWEPENIAKSDKIICEDLKKNDKTA
jgi:hypothetical protein